MEHSQFFHALAQAARQQIPLFGRFSPLCNIDDRADMCRALTLAAIDRHRGQFDMPDCPVRSHDSELDLCTR